MAGMKLIAVYIGFVLVGELIAYGLGRAVEQIEPAASMPIFLGLFFFNFWAAWQLAIRVA